MKALKTLLLIFALIGIAFLMFSLGKKGNLQSPKPIDSETTSGDKTQKVQGVSTLKLGNEEFVVSVVKVDDPSRIKLYPNFSDQKTSEEIINEGMCKNLISGGFYSETYSPIGLFISERKIINYREQNATFNGFFVLSEGNIPEILNEVREEEYRIGLQSGPILFLNSNPLTLSLKNDERARRNIIAVNKDSDVLFITVYKYDSVFSGPTLLSLPGILTSIQELTGEKIVSALNLDGGAASTFWGEGVILRELSPIGSYFCIN